MRNEVRVRTIRIVYAIHGLQLRQFPTFFAALVLVAEDGTIVLSPGATGGAIVITQPVTLECNSGTATIGMK